MAVGEPLVRETVVGVKSPPPLLSFGVTTTVPEIVSSAPTVKALEATVTKPLDGPLKVNAVAPELKEALQLAVVPLYSPSQDQVKGPLPETEEAVPAEQRFVLGALEKLWPSEEPQTPFTGAALAVNVMLLGFVRPPLFVTLMVFVPAEAAV